MIVYVLLACIANSGCFTYEFKHKDDCLITANNINNRLSGTRMVFCQEVRK